jgi:hypothetical protein
MNWFKLAAQRGRKRKNPLVTDSSILELFDRGVSPYQIALSLECSPGLVNRVLEKNNRLLNKNNYIKINSEMVKNILNILLINNIKSVKELAEKAGLSHSTCWKILANLKLDINSSHEKIKKVIEELPFFENMNTYNKTSVTPDMIQMMIEKYKSGKRIIDISRELGIPYPKVIYYLVQNKAYNKKDTTTYYDNHLVYPVNLPSKKPSERNQIKPNITDI